MTTLSNLYVEKVNSEHPLAVWMLNEEVDYLSSISETNRQFYTGGQWSTTNATSTQEVVVPEDTPFKNSALTKVAGNVPVTPNMDISLVSIYNVPTANFSEDLANFAMSFHVYIDNPYTQSITYGYQYIDTLTGNTEYITVTEDISSFDTNKWLFFSNTFDIPSEIYSNYKFIVKLSVVSGGGVGDYDFLINGFAIGQWAEEFNRTSLGVNPVPLPSNIAFPASPLAGNPDCIPATPYGASTLDAYYIAHDYKLYANNYGVPLVFGSSNVSKIIPHSHIEDDIEYFYPALIFPGYGFLNQKGKYNEYTAEIWMTLNTDAVDPRKIFGPLTGNNGLYVEGGFLTFVIGKNYGSHYVGEWYRPMLIHIRYIKDNVSILLNGEEVISIDFNEEDLNFETEFDENGKSRDWLGFFAYDDVTPVDIDSVAIYSYSVPTEVAKRRWVWGQGVIPPETTNSSLNATTAFNDYSFANYAVNYNYPDFASWRQAFFSNVVTTNNFLQLPNYALPTINLGSKTLENWYEDLQTYQAEETVKAFSFRPEISWNTELCYFYFQELSILNEATESIYGIFETQGTSFNQPLFKVINNQSQDYLEVTVEQTILKYTVVINGVSTVLKQQDVISPNNKFVAGINFTNIALQDVEGINQLFQNQNNISVYVGGNGTHTFSGLIYKFGFDAKYNDRKVSISYGSDGIALYDDHVEMMNHTANYTLVPLEKYGTFFADISVAAYWEDYMPLSYFAKYVENYNGDQFYDLDTIQVNLDYPEPLEVSALESTSSWTYADLNARYADPIQLDYSILDNSFYSGWEDYEDMSQDSEKYYYYNTEKSAVKSFISFQKITDGANSNLVDFAHKAVARVKGVVDPSTLVDVDELGNPFPGSWEDTAYEVVDGTVIYPPTKDSNNKSVDFNNLAIVSHLEFVSEGILHHPVSFRELQLASQVLERKQFTEIGTRFGVPVYPYSKTGIYYDFKGKNPVSTYKGSTPYLYLNRHSGWRIRGTFSPFVDRGVAIPINVQRGLGTQVSAIQMWLRYSDINFPTQEIPIFAIDHEDGTYDFYIKGDSSTQRGSIVARNRSTGAIVNTVEYYINGRYVDEAYLVNEEWTVLGIAFTELLNYDGYSGRLFLNGPLTYNNVSYYLATNLEQNQRVEVRSWGEVKNDPIEETWGEWKAKTLSPGVTYKWNNIKVISTINLYSIDPTAIYQKYVGTDRIIVDDNVKGILVDPETIKVYSDVTWSTSTNIAV